MTQYRFVFSTDAACLLTLECFVLIFAVTGLFNTLSIRLQAHRPAVGPFEERASAMRNPLDPTSSGTVRDVRRDRVGLHHARRQRPPTVRRKGFLANFRSCMKGSGHVLFFFWSLTPASRSW